MASHAISAPKLPFPIYRISSKVERYMLYEIKVVTWLRETYHILGVLVGTLPQIPQQNLFLGLPLELMPEEVRLLIEIDAAYIVNDHEWCMNGLQSTSKAIKAEFKHQLAMTGLEAARASDSRKLESMERAMRRLQLSDVPAVFRSHQPSERTEDLDEDGLYDARGQKDDATKPEPNHEIWAITPTSAYPPLQEPPGDSDHPIPTTNAASYALFKYLHESEYYISPGLRFGCQFMVYPGDPLRFHSHFLAIAAEWDEEINLLDIVTGGRLGTGVKKGYMVGGPEKPNNSTSEEPVARVFCIEWGGM